MFVFCREILPLPNHWNVFSSSQGLKIGSVVGYSILCRVRFRVPSPFLLEMKTRFPVKLHMF